MPYITSIERSGIAKGLLKGIESVLAVRFGATGRELLPEIRAIDDIAMLEAVLKASETVATPDELRAVWRSSASSDSGS